MGKPLGLPVGQPVVVLVAAVSLVRKRAAKPEVCIDVEAVHLGVGGLDLPGWLLTEELVKELGHICRSIRDCEIQNGVERRLWDSPKPCRHDTIALCEVSGSENRCELVLELKRDVAHGMVVD